MDESDKNLKDLNNIDEHQENKVNCLLNVSKSICKILIEDSIGSGFLIKIEKNKKDFYCLITCEHVINIDSIKKNKKIKIFYNNEKNFIEITLNKVERFIQTYINIKIDATVIEILKKDKIEEYYFLKPNENYIDGYSQFQNKNIYIQQFPNNNPLSLSHGSIIYIDPYEYEFYHTSSTQGGSSGSPVFLENSELVIGIHKLYIKNIKEIINFNGSGANCGNFIGPILYSLKNNLDYGEKYYDDGHYIGELKNNEIKEGYGRYIYNNNESYEGEWKNDKKHGKGKYMKDGIIKYEGDFYNDKYEGKGKYNLENGKFYEGEFINNCIHGKGNVYYDNQNILSQNQINISLNGSKEELKKKKNDEKKIIIKYINNNNKILIIILSIVVIFIGVSIFLLCYFLTRKNDNDYDNIYKCELGIEEKCFSCSNEKEGECSKCNNEYELFDGKCYHYSFIAKFAVDEENQNTKLINSEYVNDIIGLKVEDELYDTQSEHLFHFKGEYNVYFYIKKEKIKSFSGMFKGVNKMKEIAFYPYINTSLITNMSRMFEGCVSLISININSFNTQNVVDISEMFYDCINLTSIDLSNFNFRNLKKMSGMFFSCQSIKNINISNFNTQNVEDMSFLFSLCYSLKTIDLSNLITKNVKKMYGMFSNCNSLESINISNFNTQNVMEMDLMFECCTSLTSLDLSNFSNQSLISFENMFYGCKSLQSDNLYNFTNIYISDKKQGNCDYYIKNF